MTSTHGARETARASRRSSAPQVGAWLESRAPRAARRAAGAVARWRARAPARRAGAHRRRASGLRSAPTAGRDAGEAAPAVRASGGPRAPRARSGNATFSSTDRCGKSSRPGRRRRSARRSGGTNTRSAVVEQRRRARCAAVDRDEPGDRLDERGLAGAVRAEDRDGLAVGGRERACDADMSPRAPRRRLEGHRPALSATDALASATRTPTETTTSRSENTIAPPGRSASLVDRERQRLRPPREVAGERDRGAELAERARPREHGAGHQLRRDHRQHHAAQRVAGRGAERRGRSSYRGSRPGALPRPRGRRAASTRTSRRARRRRS